MNRREFLAASACTAASFLFGCSWHRRQKRNVGPNLILVVSDTLRADHLSCCGADPPLTPFIDDLAGRGALFKAAMSPAPLTGAAHATLMTGTYQTRHGVVDNGGRIPKALPTLAQVCWDAGYETAAFVSNPVLDPGELRGIDRGFATYDATLPSVERNRPESLYREGSDTSEAVVSWLRHKAKTPFFLWVHYMEPHGPYELSDLKLRDLVDNLPLIPGEPERLPLLRENCQPGGIPAYQVLGDERDPREYRLRYAARAAYVDRQVGRLLDELQALGLDDDTVVAFTADHGELLGEHGWYFLHGITLYGPVLRVPFVLAGPGVTSGSFASPVGTADVMPTMMDLLGIESETAQAHLQGRSLIPVMEGTSREDVPIYAISSRGKEWSVRLGPLKYTMSEENNTGREGLFDLGTDPAETRDISRERPQEAARMRRELVAFMAENQGVLGGKTTEAPSLSEEERQRLKALGYLD